jgi:AcrR family transcriptional regulator
MVKRSTPCISKRKDPKQARANALIAAILEAAVQVLRTEGAMRFTTARVAERAGVSVGSLYQYFPNKAAILFRLQSDEWRETSERLRAILEDDATPPKERLRRMVHAFVRSECDEAQVRIALHDAAPLFRDAPEAEAAREDGSNVIQHFIEMTISHVDAARRAIVADLIETTLCRGASGFSEVERSDAEIEAYASAMSDMFCAYLDSLANDTKI